MTLEILTSPHCDDAASTIKTSARSAAPRPAPLGGLYKRAFDLIAASALLLIFSPLLLLICVGIKLLSGGEILFRHKRVGAFDKEFNCLKFRSMAPNADQLLAALLARDPEAAAEWARDRKLRDDPRVTWLGRILRKTSLDELPQLWNVIVGEMSLVGPRPVMRDELERYGARRASYLAARPGITGLWQTSGRNSTTYQRRTELDEQYVLNWSFLGDINLLLKTVPEFAAWTRVF